MPRLKEFARGARDTIPLMVGAAPFGIIFGALAVSGERALTLAATMGMSLIVFAGSAQFISLGLYSQGAGTLLIVFTTLVVNLRHALYAASLAPYLSHLGARHLLPLGFWLTDETYAVVISRFQNDSDRGARYWYYVGSALPFYINWQLCTAVGIVAGTQLGDAASWGLDFAMTTTFIGLVVPLISSRPLLVCAFTAAAVSLMSVSLPNRLGYLIGALAGICAGMLAQWLSHRLDKNRDTADTGDKELIESIWRRAACAKGSSPTPRNRPICATASSQPACLCRWQYWRLWLAAGCFCAWLCP